jgi:hypothetical protein
MGFDSHTAEMVEQLSVITNGDSGWEGLKPDDGDEIPSSIYSKASALSSFGDEARKAINNATSEEDERLIEVVLSMVLDGNFDEAENRLINFYEK